MLSSASGTENKYYSPVILVNRHYCEPSKQFGTLGDCPSCYRAQLDLILEVHMFIFLRKKNAGKLAHGLKCLLRYNHSRMNPPRIVAVQDTEVVRKHMRETGKRTSEVVGQVVGRQQS